MTISAAEHELRLDLYNRNMSDLQIGKRIGKSQSAIRYWREQVGLPQVANNNHVPMEQALTESQTEQMKRFLGCLTTYADRFPDERIDVLKRNGHWG